MRKNPRSSSLLLAFFWLTSACYDAEVHYENAVIEEPVVSVTVDVGAGDILLRGAEVSAVTIDARIEGPSNHLGHAWQDGELVIFDDCHDHHCSVDLNVLVPEGVGLALHTGSGDIEVARTRGPLLLRTGSGDIAGSSVFGGDTDVETGSGDVELEVPGEIGQLLAKSGSGDIRLDVPAGAYRLDVSTGSGDREVRGVDDAADASGSLRVRTGSGDITIRGH
jgi:hypothetical protein